MISTALASHNSTASPSANLRHGPHSISNELPLRHHDSHAESTARPALPPLFAGTIHVVNPEKSYGFIEAPDGPDVFFHFSALQKPFDISAVKFPAGVEYEMVQTRKGPRATKVWMK